MRLYDGAYAPADNKEYIYDQFNYSNIKDDIINEYRSVKLNLLPANITFPDGITTYTTFDKQIHIRQTQYEDPESIHEFANVLCLDSVNLNLNLRSILNTTTNYRMIWSDVLEEGVNAVVGASTITASYQDTITGSLANETFQLEILPRDTYNRYVQLGLIDEELPTVVYVKDSPKFLEDNTALLDHEKDQQEQISQESGGEEQSGESGGSKGQDSGDKGGTGDQGGGKGGF